MYELTITTENDRITVSVERNFNYGFEEGTDYLGCKQFNTLARQELTDYQLTVRQRANHVGTV